MRQVERRATPELFNQVSLAQGAYYLVTGLWPLLSLRTFERLTGPKADDWLVRTVGVLVSVIGAVLIMAGLGRQTPREIPVLAIGSAAGLTGIDVVYTARRRISPIYLLDALAEIALIGTWLFVRRQGKSVAFWQETLRRRDLTETHPL